MAKDNFQELVRKHGGGNYFQSGEYVSTGIHAYDYILTGYGLPRGAMVMCWGKSTAGKTLLALYMMARAQEAGFHGLFFDVERGFKTAMAKTVGLSMEEDQFTYFPRHGSPVLTLESCFDALRSLLTTNKKFFVLIDTIAALRAKDHFKESSHGREGQQRASLLSDELGKIVPFVQQSGAIVLLNNQARASTDMYTPDRYPGGRSISHYMEICVQIRAKRRMVDRKGIRRAVGITARLSTQEKSRYLQFPLHMETYIAYSGGIDPYNGFYDLLVQYGVLQEKGESFLFGTGSDQQSWEKSSFEEFYEENRHLVRRAWIEEVSYTGKV